MKQRMPQAIHRFIACTFMLLALAAAAPALGQQSPQPGAPASGQSWATGRLLGFALSDLDPKDGITPSVVFTPAERGAETVVGTMKDGNVDKELDRGAMQPDGSSAAAIDGARSTSRLIELGATTASSAEDGLFAYGTAYQQQHFVLSPHSRLTLTFTGDAGGVDDDAFWDMAFVDLQVMIEHDINGNNVWHSGGGWHSEFPSAGPEYSVIVETGGIASAGHYSVGAYSSVRSSITAVPEPGAWALLLAGLAGLAILHRRSCGHPCKLTRQPHLS